MKKLKPLIESVRQGLQNSLKELNEEEISYIKEILDEADNLLKPTPAVPFPKGSEALWLLAGENPKAFKAYMKSFPNKDLNEFANSPEALGSLIGRFKSTIHPFPQQTQDEVPKADLQSSNVWGFQYDPSDKVLKVRFNNGGVYQYDGVPPFVYQMFARGAIPAKTDGQNQWGVWWRGKQPSLGASFHELIRDNFPYEKVA